MPSSQPAESRAAVPAADQQSEAAIWPRRLPAVQAGEAADGLNRGRELVAYLAFPRPEAGLRRADRADLRRPGRQCTGRLGDWKRFAVL
jgi:hypothetical protein